MRHALALLIGIAALAAAPAMAEDDPLAQYKWEARPVIVFADSDKDPRFQKQVSALAARSDDMAERDVVILLDTDPDADSALRRKFRPRDFQILLLGKDGQIKLRRPHPITAEDLNRQIDRMPMRRREMDGGQS
ncbi:MAG: DUF4174 domain-containing protein [Pseudomonadota bacterium]